MREKCRKLIESDAFEGWILTLIILNALCLGAETVPELTEQYDDLLWLVLWGSQLIFTIEIGLRLIAAGFRLPEFFRDFWNSFDFIVVAASYLPAIGAFATVARVLRVLRVLRLISVSDELRFFLDQMLRSLGLFVYAALVWGIFAYVYAIAGFYLFAEIDSNNWGSLIICLRTIFTLSLFQDVSSVLNPLWQHSPLSVFFFIAFFAGLLLLLLNVVARVVAFQREAARD